MAVFEIADSNSYWTHHRPTERLRTAVAVFQTTKTTKSPFGWLTLAFNGWRFDRGAP
jgi:hypothetical protein